MMWPWIRKPAQADFAEAARALGAIHRERQHRKVVDTMQALRRELGMPPAKVR